MTAAGYDSRTRKCPLFTGQSPFPTLCVGLTDASAVDGKYYPANLSARRKMTLIREEIDHRNHPLPALAAGRQEGLPS